MKRIEDRSPTEGVAVAPVVRYKNADSADCLDFVAVEEPLSIVLLSGDGPEVQAGVTMRTPGDDDALVTGFLYSEGLIASRHDIVRFEQIPACGARGYRGVRVVLRRHVELSANTFAASTARSAACGLCGRTSIDHVLRDVRSEPTSAVGVSPDALYRLPTEVARHQVVFGRTGGLHAAALFAGGAKLRFLSEDIGRHNAVDKVVGNALFAQQRLDGSVLFLSGRAGFELIHKAAIARIPIVAAMGAPSSRAVELARRVGLTLIGFLKETGFNVYSGPERVGEFYRKHTHAVRGGMDNYGSPIRVS